MVDTAVTARATLAGLVRSQPVSMSWLVLLVVSLVPARRDMTSDVGVAEPPELLDGFMVRRARGVTAWARDLQVPQRAKSVRSIAASTT